MRSKLKTLFVSLSLLTTLSFSSPFRAEAVIGAIQFHQGNQSSQSIGFVVGGAIGTLVGIAFTVEGARWCKGSCTDVTTNEEERAQLRTASQLMSSLVLAGIGYGIGVTLLDGKPDLTSMVQVPKLSRSEKSELPTAVSEAFSRAIGKLNPAIQHGLRALGISPEDNASPVNTGEPGDLSDISHQLADVMRPSLDLTEEEREAIKAVFALRLKLAQSR